MRLVRLWLAHEGLGEKIDGWFRGGEKWTACSREGLMSQSFCFFNPKGLIKIHKTYYSYNPYLKKRDNLRRILERVYYCQKCIDRGEFGRKTRNDGVYEGGFLPTGS